MNSIKCENCGSYNSPKAYLCWRCKKSLNKQNKPKKAPIGIGTRIGLLSGFVASLCCISPIVLIFFGLTGVSTALAISQYKLYFLLAALIFGFSTTWLYSRKVCSVKKQKYVLATTLVTMIGFYTLVSYVVLPTLAPKIYYYMDEKNPSWMEELNQNSLQTPITYDQNQPQTTKTEESKMEKTETENPSSQTPKTSQRQFEEKKLRKAILSISGMSCPSCVAVVERALRIEGVMSVKVDYRIKIATIIYDSSKIILDEIIASLPKGYGAEVLEDGEYEGR
ncbi:MAG: cation transporter [Candidatus Methanofastidiosia archaeon]